MRRLTLVLLSSLCACSSASDPLLPGSPWAKFRADLRQTGRTARSLALKLSQGPLFALGMTKEMLSREPGLSLEEALEAEAQAQQICMATRDFREAFEAFSAKREPKFEGR
jgi:enoyl-CoA hydratase/carnithine racemase